MNTYALITQFCTRYKITFQKKSTMQEEEIVSLIKGVFTDEEAKEVLMSLFAYKIRFHELKNFSSKERFGHPCATSEERIVELKKGLKQIQQTIATAGTQNMKLEVRASIHISLVDH